MMSTTASFSLHRSQPHPFTICSPSRLCTHSKFAHLIIVGSRPLLLAPFSSLLWDGVLLCESKCPCLSRWSQNLGARGIYSPLLTSGHPYDRGRWCGHWASVAWRRSATSPNICPFARISASYLRESSLSRLTGSYSHSDPVAVRSALRGAPGNLLLSRPVRPVCILNPLRPHAWLLGLLVWPLPICLLLFPLLSPWFLDFNIL